MSDGSALLLVRSCLRPATGLYTIAEFIEEHTTLTKRVLRYALLAIFALQILLWLFEDYPFLHILFSIAAHAAWGTLLRQFPFIELTNVKFIVALGACSLSPFDVISLLRSPAVRQPCP